MRSRMMKTVAVSALAVTFTVASATQVFAWCGGGGGGCWGYGGYYGQGYSSQPAQQRYVPAPQSYSSVPAAQSPQQTKTNDFDPTIYDIQVVLFDKGYYDGELDGLYGSGTKAALLKFQKDNGITETENEDIEALKADIGLLEALGLYSLL